MNWITNYVRPRINSIFSRREVPENLWHKCDECGTMLFHRELAENQNVCTQCDHHMAITPRDRFAHLFDGGIFTEVDVPAPKDDPLHFRDQKKYPDRMKAAQKLQIVAIVDPASLQYQTDAMIGIKVTNGVSPVSVAERLSQQKNVAYILWVSGRFDLLVEIISEGEENFLAFLEEEIHESPDIAHCEIMMGLKNLKNQFILKRNWA